MKARFAVLGIVIAIAGVLAVASVRVLSHTDKPELPVAEANAGKLDGPVVEQKPPRPNFTISKETTYVTRPVDKDGYVDYAAALNERLGKGITAETNANVLIWRAIGPRPHGGKGMPAEFFKLMGMEEPPENGEYFIELLPFLRDRLRIDDREQVDSIQTQSFPLTRQPWTATDHPQIAEWLKANEKPLASTIDALKRPHYFAPLSSSRNKESRDLISAVMVNTQTVRSLVTALATRAMLRVGNGKLADAWPDLVACHRLARFVARGGSLIEGLVGFACEAIGNQAAAALLERQELDAPQLLGYLHDLRTLPAMPSIADSLEGGERFMILHNLANAIRAGPDGLEALTGGAAVVPADTEFDWDAAFKTVNRHLDRMGAALRHREYGKRQTELERIDADVKALEKARASAAGKTGKDSLTGASVGDVFIALLVPAVRKMQEAFDRSEQASRNLQLALALAAYQRERSTYPKTLDAVKPKYLDSVPGDLFTGKSLVYRPDDKGFLLYSFGPNGKDDEGRWYGDNPKGDDPNIRVPRPRPSKK